MAFDGLLIRLFLVTALSLAASVKAFAAGASTSSVKNPRPSSTSMLRAMSQEEVVHSRRKALTTSLAFLTTVAPRVAQAAAAAATANQTDTITKSTSGGGSDAKSSAPKTNVVSNTSSSKSTATSSKTASNNAKQQLENPGDVKNCSDFKDYKQAKTWYDTYFSLYGDVARLDGDKDGIPCESLPGAPKKTKK